jgi:hypothetical protein
MNHCCVHVPGKQESIQPMAENVNDGTDADVAEADMLDAVAAVVFTMAAGTMLGNSCVETSFGLLSRRPPTAKLAPHAAKYTGLATMCKNPFLASNVKYDCNAERRETTKVHHTRESMHTVRDSDTHNSSSTPTTYPVRSLP